MLTYKVTEQGLQEIKEWLLYEWAMEDKEVGDLSAAIYAYADRAEDAEDGEIELRARETASGRPSYLRPERVPLLHDYYYYTDGESGHLQAATWEDACRMLDAMFTPAVIEDGGFGVLRDHIDGHDDYVIGVRS